MLDNGVIRQFDTGATRDTGQDKFEYEGFFSPLVLERRAQYMHKHRYLSDGSTRASDNWQQGIPSDVCMQSLFRHFVDLWIQKRTIGTYNQDAVCAMMFNLEAILHNELGRERWS